MGDEADAMVEWYSRSPSFRLLGIRDTPARYRPLKPLPKREKPIQSLEELAVDNDEQGS